MVALDFLCNGFEMTTTFFLYLGDKNLKEIQQIVTSTEVVNLAKQIVKITANLAMIAKKKQSETSSFKSKINKKCFNYGKTGHYAKDCCFSTWNKRKLEELLEKAKQA